MFQSSELKCRWRCRWSSDIIIMASCQGYKNELRPCIWPVRWLCRHENVNSVTRTLEHDIAWIILYIYLFCCKESSQDCCFKFKGIWLQNTNNSLSSLHYHYCFLFSWLRGISKKHKDTPEKNIIYWNTILVGVLPCSESECDFICWWSDIVYIAWYFMARAVMFQNHKFEN